MAIGGYLANSYDFKLMWYVKAIAACLGATYVLLTLKEPNRKVAITSHLNISLKNKLFSIKEEYSLFIMYLVIFSFGVQSNLVFPFLPGFLEENGMSKFLIGLVSSISSLIMGIALIFIGRLSDRIGRKPLLITGLIIGGASVGLIPIIANNLILLFIVSSFANIGLSGWYLIQVVQAFIADLSPPQRLGSAIGIVFTMLSLGTMIGSLIGQYLWKTTHPTIPFFLSMATNLVMALIIIQRVKETVIKKKLK